MKRKTQIAVIIISILCLLVGTSVLADEQISGFLQSHNIVSSVNSIAEKITSKLLTEGEKEDKIAFVRRNGGIGRRARFRSVW